MILPSWDEGNLQERMGYLGITPGTCREWYFRAGHALADIQQNRRTECYAAMAVAWGTATPLDTATGVVNARYELDYCMAVAELADARNAYAEEVA